MKPFVLALFSLFLLLAGFQSFAADGGRRCLSDCTPRIGIVSAFGAEADILIAQTTGRKRYTINGNRFTTGLLRGNRVVIVLSGVSMVNAAMATQLLLDHFHVDRLVMSGIAGGLNPELHVGDVTVPDRWIMPMEVYWSHDSQLPKPCGAAGDLACLGMKLAQDSAGKVIAPFELPAAAPAAKAASAATAPVATGLFMRESALMSRQSSPKGESIFAYPVDSAMLAVARNLAPVLKRCADAVASTATATAAAAAAPIAAPVCVRQQPRLLVGGAGVSGTAFLANASYRAYLHTTLQANTVDMETAALAHVARANGVPFIAFRSLSDLAGGEEFNPDVAALFGSGLAEANEAAVTLAFLQAWSAQKKAKANSQPNKQNNTTAAN